MSEYDKEEYDFLLEFILHEECLLLKHIDKTVDKTHLLVTSENNIEFLTNALPWTPFEPAKQYLTLLLETVKFLGKDILTDVEIKIESKMKELKIKGCSVRIKFWVISSREENLSTIRLKVEDLLILGFSCTFKWSGKLDKLFFTDKSCFQRWCIE